MKAGFGGFVALIFLFGAALRTGARAALRTARGDFAAITLTSTAFIAMFAIFAYVDIAWDAQNVVLLAVAMAQISLAAGRLPRPRRAPPDQSHAEAGSDDEGDRRPVQLSAATTASVLTTLSGR
jgi:hypothetical protein